MPVGDARDAIKNQVISIGIAPAQDGNVPSLKPIKPTQRRNVVSGLIYEIPEVVSGAIHAKYKKLNVLSQSDILNETGIVQLQLPNDLKTWSFDSPLEEGTEDFPPRLEDEKVRNRLITWIRVRLPFAGEMDLTESQIPDARLRWLGINATRILQSVPIVSELIGTGSGEPDQIYQLAMVFISLPMQGKLGQIPA